MPVMTGDLFARSILKIRPEIPIILCTGYSEKISESEAFEIGLRRFVQKPIDTKKLLSLIREVLDERNSDTDN